MAKIADYLKILTDEEVKDSLVINFGECFKSTREAFYSKQGKEINLRKVSKSFYIFLTTLDEVKKYVEFVKN